LSSQDGLPTFFRWTGAQEAVPERSESASRRHLDGVIRTRRNLLY
jgi:hypothetical protein